MKLEKISRIPDIPKDFLDSENYLEFPRNFLKISRFPGTWKSEKRNPKLSY